MEELYIFDILIVSCCLHTAPVIFCISNTGKYLDLWLIVKALASARGSVPTLRDYISATIQDRDLI